MNRGIYMETILQFKNLNYHYKSNNKKITILDNVNFSFQAGHFYTILGPSGSGKTTTLSLASGLDIPRSGSVLYKGTDIRKIGLDSYRNQHVSIIFQSYNLITYMTALQNVVTAMEITGVDVRDKKGRALELLEKVGLTEVEAKRKVLQLSGGQQQRVAIARALSCNVDLLIADEPTGNLDQVTSLDIIELFKELAHKENKCIIVVTHSQEVARQSDTAVYLEKRNLVIKNVIRRSDFKKRKGMRKMRKRIVASIGFVTIGILIGVCIYMLNLDLGDNTEPNQSPPYQEQDGSTSGVAKPSSDSEDIQNHFD